MPSSKQHIGFCPCDDQFDLSRFFHAYFYFLYLRKPSLLLFLSFVVYHIFSIILLSYILVRFISCSFSSEYRQTWLVIFFDGEYMHLPTSYIYIYTHIGVTPFTMDNGTPEYHCCCYFFVISLFRGRDDGHNWNCRRWLGSIGGRISRRLQMVSSAIIL